MNVLIDCTNLKVGGGIQVATSFINDLKVLDLKINFIAVLSREMEGNFSNVDIAKNIKIINLPEKIRSKGKISKFLRQIEKDYLINRVFCVFGPSYYKSSVKKIVGYALPHFIYSESPFFKLISLKSKIRLFLLEKIQIYLFKKNSDELIFETEDAKNRFNDKYSFKKTCHVVSNTLNEVFLNQAKWEFYELSSNSDLKILCLSANYPHKNLNIIPRVIDHLIQLGLSNFKFYISVEKHALGFPEKYSSYIDFIGKVPLNRIPSLFSQVDIVFMPTLLEVFSTTFLEAMYMEKPLVVADMSFSRDVCYDAALYYEPTNEMDAAQKIFQIAKDDDLRENLIANGEINLKRFGSSMDRTRNYIKIIES